MRRTVGNGLVKIHIAVANFNVESAIRVAAYPSLVVNRRPLASKVRQGE